MKQLWVIHMESVINEEIQTQKFPPTCFEKKKQPHNIINSFPSMSQTHVH